MTSVPASPQRYAYAGWVVESGFPLPELTTAPAVGAADITVVHGPQVAECDDHAWLHHWVGGEDQTDLSLARIADRYLLRFPELADILLADSGAIEVNGFDGTSARSLRHLLLDQAIPRWLAHRGNLVLHASAATTSDGRAVVILGHSGQGKSTLATALAAQWGGAVLADDCVVIGFDGDGALALPSYPGVRLWPDSVDGLFPASTQTELVNDYSDKYRVALAAPDRTGRAAAWPIAAFLHLDERHDGLDHGVRIGDVDASRACMVLIGNAFQLDIGDMRHVHRLLAIAADAAQRAPVLSLRYPRDYAVLPQVADTILQQLRDVKPS